MRRRKLSDYDARTKAYIHAAACLENALSVGWRIESLGEADELRVLSVIHEIKESLFTRAALRNARRDYVMGKRDKEAG